MRTHDNEPEAAGGGRGALHAQEADAGDLASRALAAGRTGALDGGAMLHLQASAGNASVSRLVNDDQEAAAGPRRVREVLSSRGGRPLEPQTAQLMTQRLGHDFSDVRVHTDTAASESARSVNAHAYTVGSDIVFQSDRYSPDSTAGQRMIAHELSHVVQQRSGPVSGTPVGGGVRVSHPSDSFERAAEHTADQVMAGGPSEPAAPAPAGIQRQTNGSSPSGVQVQRQEAPEEEKEEGAGLMAQRQEAPEDEKEEGAGLMAQRQEAPEEEKEEGAGLMAQRQEAPEEEEEPAKG